ncbi:MAG: branched-chain amino acid ABC transporter permease [Thermomicrobiales bacterium]|nr:branched-chain amino acid ABC transporter permease [Thermomicrobiales bacterium]
MRSVLRDERILLAGTLVLCVVPFVFGNYWTGLLTQALIFAGVAMGLDILVGFTGMPSLGHAAFFGLSGYGAAIGIQRYDLNPWLAALTGIMFSIALAVLFAPLAVRMRGLAFLTIMLAFGQVCWGIATRGGDFTGGENGLPGIPRPSLGLGWWDLKTTDGFYYFTLVCTVLVSFVLVRIARSAFGASLLGIRENETRMMTMGYHVAARRAAAFSIAAGAGAIFGVLSAFFNGYVGPGTLDWRLSAQFLLSVVIGGAGSLWGPFVAGGGLHIVKTYITGQTQYWPMVLGALYVFAVVVLPGGIASLITLARNRRNRSSGPATGSTTAVSSK